jgi:Tfp pilus assembly protein PilF
MQGQTGNLKIRRSIATAVMVAASFGIFLFGSLKTTHAGTDETTDRAQYAAKVRETYSFKIAPGQPFLPSNAKIEGDDFIQSGAFPTAQYCRHCHEASYHQWRQSLHANSFRTPFYRKNVNLLIQTKGQEAARHCEGCHAPIALLSGAVTPNPIVTDRRFDDDGITCSVCHSIKKLQPLYGLGSYVMGIPSVITDEKGQPIPGEVSYAEITAHPDRHKAAVMKDFYKTTEFCSACHKANIPDALNNYKWLRAIGLYDEWQQSSYAKRSPLPFYKKDFSSCQTCHMPKETAEGADYGAKDGKLASHRWLGGNTAIPFYYGYDEQLQKTIDYLKAQKLNVDLFALRINNSENLVAPLGSTSFTLKPADTVQAIVVIQNKGVGHTLIPEQRDMYQAWVEFEVTDADGKVISHSGFLKPDGYLDERAHSFVTRLVDAKGNLLINHEIWNRRTIATDATIRPGRSTVVRYEFKLPAVGKGPYNVTARVDYRHFNEDFTRFVLGADHPSYPVVAMAERTRVLNIGENKPAAADPAKDNADWMRWNNYGIGLLDEMQYAESAAAFAQVAKMRPDYADALTNIGLVSFQWEKYDQAAESLKKALALAPDDPRATYYMGLVKRNQGDLDTAVTDFKMVSEKFPQSSDAHRELGFSYYQQHKYDLAREQYELVQGIDPDDLSAHYNLAIIYRRLGQKDKAAEQAAFFGDKKDDPMAGSAALAFLRAHPELSSESVPWHLHSTNEQGEPVAATKK